MPPVESKFRVCGQTTLGAHKIGTWPAKSIHAASRRTAPTRESRSSQPFPRVERDPIPRIPSRLLPLGETAGPGGTLRVQVPLSISDIQQCKEHKGKQRKSLSKGKIRSKERGANSSTPIAHEPQLRRLWPLHSVWPVGKPCLIGGGVGGWGWGSRGSLRSAPVRSGKRRHRFSQHGRIQPIGHAIPMRQ